MGFRKQFMGKLNRLIGRQLRIKRETVLPEYEDGNSAWMNISENWAIYLKDKENPINTGYLWRGRNRHTGQIAFVKQTVNARVQNSPIMRKYFDCWNDLKYSSIRECKLLEASKGHPNIIQFYDYIVDDANKFLYLVMEYPENSMSLNYYFHIHMREILKSEDGEKKERFARELLRQIVSAVGYLHEHYIVHRDLKLENIVVCPRSPRPYETADNQNPQLSAKDIIYKSPFDDDWTAPCLKLCDFGLSTVFYDNGSDGWLDGRVGTQTYFAPEVVQDLGHPGFTADNWALGIIAYILATGYHPFTYGPGDFKSFTQAVQNDIICARYFRPKWMSTDFKHFLRRVLRQRWQGRANITEIANHPWMNSSTSPLSYFNHPFGVKHWWMPPKYHLVKDLYPNVDFLVPAHRKERVVDVDKMNRVVLDEIAQGYYGWIYSYGFEELPVDEMLIPSIRRVNGRSCKNSFYYPDIALYYLVEELYQEKGLIAPQVPDKEPAEHTSKTAAQQIVDAEGKLPDDENGSRRSSNTMVNAETDDEDRRRSVDTVDSKPDAVLAEKQPVAEKQQTAPIVFEFHSLVSGF